jgi:hyperosmotically inducible protein
MESTRLSHCTTEENVMNTKLAYALSIALLASISLPLSSLMANETTADEVESTDTDEARTAGEVVDDMSIAAQTKAALAADPTTDAVDVDIEVDKANVQLNGFVDTEAERVRAEEIARGVGGVASVTNNLQIQPRDRTAGEYVDDKVLIAEVKAALAEDPVAHALEIDIEADQGVVSLGGHVGTTEEREAAYRAATQVAGVVKVINNLDVRS